MQSHSKISFNLKTPLLVSVNPDIENNLSQEEKLITDNLFCSSLSLLSSSIDEDVLYSKKIFRIIQDIFFATPMSVIMFYLLVKYILPYPDSILFEQAALSNYPDLFNHGLDNAENFYNQSLVNHSLPAYLPIYPSIDLFSYHYNNITAEAQIINSIFISAGVIIGGATHGALYFAKTGEEWLTKQKNALANTSGIYSMISTTLYTGFVSSLTFLIADHANPLDSTPYLKGKVAGASLALADGWNSLCSLFNNSINCPTSMHYKNFIETQMNEKANNYLVNNSDLLPAAWTTFAMMYPIAMLSPLVIRFIGYKLTPSYQSVKNTCFTFFKDKCHRPRTKFTQDRAVNEENNNHPYLTKIKHYLHS